MGLVVASAPAGQKPSSYAREELLVSRDRTVITENIDANGDALIQFGPPGPGQNYEIERIAVCTVGGTRARCNVYLGTLGRSALVDFTYLGANDVTEYPKGLLVPQQIILFLQFTNGTEDEVAVANIQYAVKELMTVEVVS